MDKYIKPTYYIDSSVFLSVIDDEHKRYARYFFTKLFDQHFVGVASSIIWEELNTEHKYITDLPVKYWKKSFPFLKIAEFNDKSLKLARTYIESGIFIPEDFVSALNVAIASVNRYDAFISWDYRGTTNRFCRNQVEGINRLFGERSIEFYTPAMV